MISSPTPSVHRLLVALAAVSLLGSCGPSDATGDGAGRAPAPLDEPEGDPQWGHSPPGHDDPKGGIPDDADRFVTGPVLRGTVVRGADVRPLEGFSVREWGGEEATVQVTGEDGVFAVELTDQASPAVHVRRSGWVETVMLCSEASRLYFRGEYKIEMFEAEEEAGIAVEEFGQPHDRTKGRVVFNFQPLGSGGGVQVELHAPGAKGWIYDEQDRPRAGTLLPDPPGPGEVVWTDVPPGTWPVTVRSEAPKVCVGPAEVPALADGYTRAYYFCQTEQDHEASRQDAEERRRAAQQ